MRVRRGLGAAAIMSAATTVGCGTAATTSAIPDAKPTAEANASERPSVEAAPSAAPKTEVAPRKIEAFLVDPSCADRVLGDAKSAMTAPDGAEVASNRYGDLTFPTLRFGERAPLEQWLAAHTPPDRRFVYRYFVTVTAGKPKVTSWNAICVQGGALLSVDDLDGFEGFETSEDFQISYRLKDSGVERLKSLDPDQHVAFTLDRDALSTTAVGTLRKRGHAFGFLDKPESVPGVPPVAWKKL